MIVWRDWRDKKRGHNLFFATLSSTTTRFANMGLLSKLIAIPAVSSRRAHNNFECRPAFLCQSNVSQRLIFSAKLIFIASLGVAGFIFGKIGALVAKLVPSLSDVFATKFTRKDKKYYLYTFPFSHYCEKARWAMDRSQGKPSALRVHVTFANFQPVRFLLRRERAQLH
jgi:hypothetical protein